MSNHAGPSFPEDDTDSESGISNTNSETDTSTGDGGDGGDGGDMSSKSGTFQAGDATGGSADLGNQSSGSGGLGGGGGDQQNNSTASTNGQAPVSSAGSGNGARTGVPARDSLNLDSSNPTVAGDSSDSTLSAGGGRSAGTTRTTPVSQEDSVETICLDCGGVPASQGAGQGAFGVAEQGRGASPDVPGESLAGRVDPVAALVLAGVLVLMAIRTAAKMKLRSRPGRPSAPVA